MATSTGNQTPTTGAANAAQKDDEAEAKSVGSPIPSVVVQPFYDENQCYIPTDATYVYQPKEGQPYPWSIMRPLDQSLNDSLKKEFTEFKDQKRDKLDAKSSTKELLRRLGE